jgi:stage II sporulation protein D
VEAQKAQAVAARTYALHERGNLADQGYDLDDTTRCQNYAGLDGESSSASAAVDATRGEVLTYHGALINAPYSTDCGGVTACDTTGNAPYLQAVRDAPDGGPDYCAAGKYHAWTQIFSPSDLERLLQADARTRVSSLMDLTIDGFDASGRITTATVTGKDGERKTVTGPQFRAILGPDRLRGTRTTLSRTSAGDYVFTGSGWGHGFGLCQLGASAMANAPYNKTYREILAHYYVGTEIAKDVR